MTPLPAHSRGTSPAPHLALLCRGLEEAGPPRLRQLLPFICLHLPAGDTKDRQDGPPGPWGRAGQERTGPLEPSLPLQGQVCLAPHQHHGHAMAMGRVRAWPPPGPPPRRDSTYRIFPRLPYSLLRSCGEKGSSGHCPPLGSPPRALSPEDMGTAQQRGWLDPSPPQGGHRVHQDVAVGADDKRVWQDGVLVLGRAGPVPGVTPGPAAPQPLPQVLPPVLPAQLCPPAAAGTHPCPPSPCCCRLWRRHHINGAAPDSCSPRPGNSLPHTPGGASAPGTRLWGTAQRWGHTSSSPTRGRHRPPTNLLLSTVGS